MRLLILLWLCLSGAFVSPGRAAHALVRAGSLTVNAAEIVVALPAPVTVRQLALDQPRRLVIDLEGVDAGRQIVAGTGASGAAVRSARIGQFDADTARIVIELDRPMRVGSAASGPDGLTLRLAPIPAAVFADDVKRPRRLLPVTGTRPALPASPAVAAPVAKRPAPGDFNLPDDMFAPAPAPVIATPPPPRVEVPRVAPPPRSGGSKPLVVIDAGHGGKDVGAIAVIGGYEKDVTLAIAKAAQRALERSGKVRVLLTRGDDRFIPLGGRVTIARNARADLFVSVHADSAPNAMARGASVYTLSEVASDAIAARLAQRENRADIVAGVNFGTEAPEVEGILIDLLRRSTMNDAIVFAETLQDSLDDAMPFRGEFHHFAGFRVLKAPDVPSVLLETGYVTNSDDAAALFSRDGQRRIGEGIARAVEKHLLRGR